LQHRHLVAQHQQLGILGRRASPQQHKPPQCLAQQQLQQSEGHAPIIVAPWPLRRTRSSAPTTDLLAPTRYGCGVPSRSRPLAQGPCGTATPQAPSPSTGHGEEPVRGGSDRPTRTCHRTRRAGRARDSWTSRARLLRSGLHAAVATAEVARVTDSVVVVSGGARACPLGVRCQQRVGPVSDTAPPPGRNTTHECPDPSEHLFSPCDVAVPRSHGSARHSKPP
jgi:hypothetical protein